jgi:hypothetical protein
MQCLALPGAVAPARRHSPASNFGAHRVLGTTRTLPRPSPAASTGELAGISAGPPPAAPGDPIASPQLFPGAHLRIKGMPVKPKIFQGPSAKHHLK